MTAPIWMALPPEVHSALLSAGAGPGSLLAAAEQWQQLGVQYGQAAAELSTLLAGVHAGSWEGASAEQYVCAHVPYLAWLEQFALDAAVTGAQHATVAAAYSTALATMPSLPELAANHVANGVLVATNFLGINAIPIAVNEADYARMWVQAAETMTVYQAVSETASAAVPPAKPAPAILKADVQAEGLLLNPPTSPTQLLNDIVSFIEQLGTTKQIEQLLADFQYFFQQLGLDRASAAVLAFVALWLYDVLWYPYYASYALLLAPLFAPALSALSALTLLNQNPTESAHPVGDGAHPDAVRRAAPHQDGGLAAAPTVVSTIAPQAGSPAPPASAPAAGASPTTEQAAGYAVRGFDPPAAWTGPTTGAERPDAATDTVAADVAAQALAGVRHRARRTKKARGHDHGYRHEFLDMNGSVDTSAAPAPVPASGRGAGSSGFSGALSSGAADPSGMVVGATAPVLPTTWSIDGPSGQS